MTTTRSVVLLVALAVVGLTVAPVASGAFVGATDGESEADEAEPDMTVGEFVHSSSADAQNEIDEEMFEANYNEADNDTRADLARERMEALEERASELESEYDDLDGESEGAAREARMTQLSVHVVSLNDSIDRTTTRANESGVDRERIEEFRSSASELSGSEVSEIARNLSGFDDHPGAGPPADRGPDGQNSDGVPPGQAGDDDGETGPPFSNGTDGSAENGTDAPGPVDGIDDEDGLEGEDDTDDEEEPDENDVPPETDDETEVNKQDEEPVDDSSDGDDETESDDQTESDESEDADDS